jgi:hypothetical protein
MDVPRDRWPMWIASGLGLIGGVLVLAGTYLVAWINLGLLSQPLHVTLHQMGSQRFPSWTAFAYASSWRDAAASVATAAALAMVLGALGALLGRRWRWMAIGSGLAMACGSALALYVGLKTGAPSVSNFPPISIIGRWGITSGPGRGILLSGSIVGFISAATCAWSARRSQGFDRSTALGSWTDCVHAGTTSPQLPQGHP